MLHAVSDLPYPHAEIIKMDYQPRREASGVRAV
jgi:hypothetical protein